MVRDAVRALRQSAQRRHLFGMRPEWEMVPDADATWRGKGWSHESIVATQVTKWSDFIGAAEAPRAFGQSHEAAADAPPDIGSHNTIVSFGYVLGRVAQGRSKVSLLDWGGGLGHYGVYARKLFPEVSFDFVVKDLPGLCDAGRKLLPEASFVSDDDEALSRRYDLVFASSSTQYERDCYGLIGRLADSASQYLFITRIPVVDESDDFVVVQRPQAFGYMTEYPGWFLNRKRLIDFVLQRGFVLEREFLVAERPVVANAPEQGQYRGFLFRRVTGEAS
jgi:putative methyltransferase (TIGR04325 family)